MIYTVLIDLAVYLPISFAVMLGWVILVDWLAFRLAAKITSADTAWEALLENSGQVSTGYALIVAVVLTFMMIATDAGAGAIIAALLGNFCAVWTSAPIYRWRHRAYVAHKKDGGK